MNFSLNSIALCSVQFNFREAPLASHTKLNIPSITVDNCWIQPWVDLKCIFHEYIEMSFWINFKDSDPIKGDSALPLLPPDNESFRIVWVCVDFVDTHFRCMLDIAIYRVSWTIWMKRRNLIKTKKLNRIEQFYCYESWGSRNLTLFLE